MSLNASYSHFQQKPTQRGSVRCKRNTSYQFMSAPTSARGTTSINSHLTVGLGAARWNRHTISNQSYPNLNGRQATYWLVTCLPLSEAERWWGCSGVGRPKGHEKTGSKYSQAFISFIILKRSNKSTYFPPFYWFTQFVVGSLQYILQLHRSVKGNMDHVAYILQSKTKIENLLYRKIS